MKKEQFILVIVISFMLNNVIQGGGWAMEANLESNWRDSYRKVDKAYGIVKYLIENYSFSSQSHFDPKNPPVYADFGRYPTVVIYTIVETKEQDKILGVISQYMQDNDINIVIVKFYEGENWKVKKNASGDTVKMRGPERLIKEIKLRNQKKSGKTRNVL